MNQAESGRRTLIDTTSPLNRPSSAILSAFNPIVEFSFWSSPCASVCKEISSSSEAAEDHYRDWVFRFQLPFGLCDDSLRSFND